MVNVCAISKDFLFVSLVTNRVSPEEVCLPSFDVLNCWLNLVASCLDDENEIPLKVIASFSASRFALPSIPLIVLHSLVTLTIASNIGGKIDGQLIYYLCYVDDKSLINISSIGMFHLWELCDNFSSENSLFYIGLKSYYFCFKSLQVQFMVPIFYVDNKVISYISKCKYFGICISETNVVQTWRNKCKLIIEKVLQMFLCEMFSF